MNIRFGFVDGRYGYVLGSVDCGNNLMFIRVVWGFCMVLVVRVEVMVIGLIGVNRLVGVGMLV